MRRVGIYRIENAVSGHSYVGQSVNVDRRWREHKRASIRGVKNALYDAMRSYGAEKFVFSVLELCDRAALNDREQYWIDKMGTFRQGYNLTSGGDSCERSASTKAKLSAREVTPTWRARISEAKRGSVPHNKGKLGLVRSAASRAAQSAATKGKPKSPEHRAKLRIALATARARLQEMRVY